MTIDVAKEPVLKSCFPYFGGKSAIAYLTWNRFGAVRNYIEPFCGSAAVLLARPEPFDGVECINDANGFIANLWRCMKRDPLKLAYCADMPVSEVDMHASGDAIFYHDDWYEKRGHVSRAAFNTRLDNEIEFCDFEIAGYWVHGQCSWIGSGWGTANGNSAGTGLRRILPHLGDAGRGVNRKRPHLGSAGMGVNRKRPDLGDAGMGVNRKLPHLGDAGRGWLNTMSDGNTIAQCLSLLPAVTDRMWMLFEYFAQLAGRLRRVRICSGDWSRVCFSPSTTTKHGLTALFVDPPYATELRDDCYGDHNSYTVAHEVREWAKTVDADPLMRICIAGYDGEHNELVDRGWSVVEWKAQGGHSNQGKKNANENKKLERLWFSPHCLRPDNERMLWDAR